jgi:murein DD-endopeptidase MepM/ murein hydrolase activator NlpD
MMSLRSVTHNVLRQKFIVVLATLIVFGALGVGSFFAGSGKAEAAVSCSSYYTVVSGDTLSQIAARYHSSVQAIGQANSIANVNLIYPGQNFCIPAGSTVTPSQATTTTTTSTASVSAPSVPQQSVSVPSGSSSVASMIDQVFGPYAPTALQIAQCESGLNPGAYNPTSIGGSHAAGVFQILYPSTWAGTSEAAASPYDAMSNILAAHEIFVRDGYSWREWTCQ